MTSLPRPVRAVLPAARARHRARALAAALLLPATLAGLALTGCSSSTGPDGTSAAPVRATRPAGPALPAVRNATDLSLAPRAAAGSGAAPTGLVTRDLVTGTGTRATATSTVRIQYSGVLWRNGDEFDSTWAGNGGQAVTFPLSGTIPGFGRGIDGMRVGGRREIAIPPALGYGPMGGQPPTILADDTLVFVVDLLAVAPASAGSGAGGAEGAQP
ncbi:FKBP-type peptidyl-prolyl cis-trans isomerase [Frankia canadensis]|uniref:FKBP-type peptidyl-prolyl cis-trans isomerase n=1 Tax=Frankia canadensis TaxID=1836972 RepID=UPI000C7B9069|nr:FKBP-type peptidyl-prolyl cis-trans isomerase [Frankia canadensis]